MDKSITKELTDRINKLGEIEVAKIDEIRKCKAEIQAIKREIQKGFNQGMYYRVDDRLIISAPEIIIGNVDESGILLPGNSSVTIRSNKIDLQGVGDTGCVHTCAASIRQTAVDTGIDGNEEVVGATSEIVSRAGAVMIESVNSEDVLTPSFVTPPSRGEISIHADSELHIESSIAAEKHEDRLKSELEILETNVQTLFTELDKDLELYEETREKLDNIMDKSVEISVGDDIPTRYRDLGELQEGFAFQSFAFTRIIDALVKDSSKFTELNRKLEALSDIRDKITKGDDYKNKNTGARVSIVGERIDMVSKDGEGNLRDNEGAGIGLLANVVEIESRKTDQSLNENGLVRISAQNVNISTMNITGEEYNDDKSIKKGDYPVVGCVNISSKYINMRAVDHEIKDSGAMQEKELTKGGRINMRAETMNFDATATDGKATGSIGINSKTVNIRSMDVDKDKRTDDKLAAEGSMLLLSENMSVGWKDKDHKSKMLQAASEDVRLFADKTLVARQGKNDAVVQLEGGVAYMAASSENQIFGDTTVYSNLEVKGDVKGPKATIDNLEAKSSFKSPNTSDGIATPVPATSSSFNNNTEPEDLTDEGNADDNQQSKSNPPSLVSRFKSWLGF